MEPSYSSGLPLVDPRFADEAERLQIVRSYDGDALEDDPELDAIVRFAARLCNAPTAAITLVEDVRQRFLVREGLGERETPRNTSFCAHAMLEPELMEVRDATKDERFADNELVTGDMQLRYYAGQPLISKEGAPLGALCVIDTVVHSEGLDDFQREGMEVLAQAVMRRLNARRSNTRLVREIEEREKRMQRVLEGMPTIAWSADSDGNFDYFNSRWREWTGAQPPKLADDWRPFVHPDDSEEVFAAWAESVARNEEFEVEYRLKHADGSWHWVISSALPVPETPEGGGGIRWYGTLTDIDDVHHLLNQRDMLARELSHRIKNIFAVVIGLASLKVKRMPEHAPFATELTDIMRALNRAHDFVRPESGVVQESLHGLLNALFMPYSLESGDSRLSVHGTDAKIGPSAATPLALVFHELATNSVKYGALSLPEGLITVDVQDEDDMIGITWTETGGPPVLPPEKQGFGTRLLDMTVSGQLGGSFERQFDPKGLIANLKIAKAAISD